MVSAKKIVSTSIAEGFGLAFIEPWIFDNAFSGRAIPGITDDFVDAGIPLDHLYTRIPIPVEVIGRKLFVEQLDASLQRIYSAYGLEYSGSGLSPSRGCTR